MIRKAELTDIEQICRLFRAARHRMHTGGNPTQWVNGYPSEADVTADIGMGVCYVLEDETGVYGVFSCIPGREVTYDRIYEGAWLNDEPYATIHRIASSGAHRGVLQSAVEFCLKRYRNLRIDTHRNNLPMRGAIKKAGFQYCGIIYLNRPGDDERLAFQLPGDKA